MKLCDYWIPKHPGQPPGPCATGPLRSTSEPNPLRCQRCNGWAPHGSLPSHERVTILTRELASLADKLDEDYMWAHGVAFAPRGSNGAGGPRNGHSDPVGGVITDAGRNAVRAYAAIAARLLEQAINAIRNADDAIGGALLATEPPGHKEHTKSPWHDNGGLRYPDPAVHEAQARRYARGEGIPQ